MSNPNCTAGCGLICNCEDIDISYIAVVEESNNKLKREVAVLNAERNALLALVAEKDEALSDINSWLLCAGIASIEDMAQSFMPMQSLAQQALSLTPNNVRLVEVGTARRVDGSSLLTMDSFDANKVPAGTKLYTIEKV
jgi:hypothetical protein